MTWYYTKKILKMLPEKWLELIDEFGKVAGHKISNSELSEREIKETIPFTTSSKRKIT